MSEETSYPAGTKLHPRIRLKGFDYADPDAIYFVTIRAAPETQPFRDPRTAKLGVDQILDLRDRFGVSVYAFIVMPDHVHILLRLEAGKVALGRVIGAYKSLVGLAWLRWGNSGHMWQEKFYDHIVRKKEGPEEVVEYILGNPVRAGIVANPQDYPYSGMPDPL